MTNKYEWSNNSSIEGATTPDHEGESCVDFYNEIEYTYLNKQDVINLAKIFNLTSDDLK